MTEYLAATGPTAANSSNWAFRVVEDGVDTSSGSTEGHGRLSRRLSDCRSASTDTPENSPEPEKEEEEDQSEGGGGVEAEEDPADTDHVCSETFREVYTGRGRRLVDLEKLNEAIERHTVCRRCSESLVTQILGEFADFLDQDTGSISAADMVPHFIKSFSTPQRRLRLPSHELVRDDVCGLASSLTFRCRGLHCHASGVMQRASSGNRHRFTLSNFTPVPPEPGEPKVRGAKRADVNQQAALAMMGTGNSARDLHIIAAHLDVPVPSSFAL